MSRIEGPQRLGPLTPLVGEWEGNTGVDLSYHNADDVTGKTSYFSIASFHPIPLQTNGQQNMEGLSYKMTDWRHGEESMAPFHDESGYLLWDKNLGKVLRCVVFGRGIAIMAVAEAGARDTTLTFTATPGAKDYGILQNEYLLQRAELKSFKSVFTFNDDGTFTHNSDIVLRLKAQGDKDMHHTDKQTLHRVHRISESVEDN